MNRAGTRYNEFFVVAVFVVTVLHYGSCLMESNREGAIVSRRGQTEHSGFLIWNNVRMLLYGERKKSFSNPRQCSSVRPIEITVQRSGSNNSEDDDEQQGIARVGSERNY